MTNYSPPDPRCQDVRAWAHFYLERGWPLTVCRNKIPFKTGWVELARGFAQDQGPDAHNALESLLDEGGSDVQIGVLLGPELGFIITEFDLRNGGTLEALLRRLGLETLPATRITVSGSGGFHLWWRRPAELGPLPASTQLGVGLELLADGKQVIIPPSPYTVGGQRLATYSWHEASQLPAEPPPALRDILRERATRTAELDRRVREEGDSSIPQAIWKRYLGQPTERIRLGERDDTMMRIARSLRAGFVDIGPAEVIYETIWRENVDQTPGDEFTWDDAVDILRRTWEHVTAGPSVDWVDQNRAKQTLATPDEELVAAEVKRLKVRTQARAALAAELWTPPVIFGTIAEELELPVEPITWLVQDLLPVDANVLLTAQYKTGKTTLLLELLASLVTGEPFLGRFEVARDPGRVGYLNYEVHPGMIRRWVAELGVDRTAWTTANFIHLRGMSLPLSTEAAFADLVTKARELEWRTVVLDPFARAFSDYGDENSNSDVLRWTERVDEFKRESGVETVIVVTHTGRGQEAGHRARGATRLDDWADVRWVLQHHALTAREDLPEDVRPWVGSNTVRRLDAHGRDVDREQDGAVVYVRRDDDRRLEYLCTFGECRGGGDDDAEERRTVARRWAFEAMHAAVRSAVLALLEVAGDDGVPSTAAILRALPDLPERRTRDLLPHLELLEREGLVERVERGRALGWRRARLGAEDETPEEGE